MRHIQASIVSRHLSTRGNKKILRTPPPHISSSEEILLHLTRHTLTQLRTNKSPFLKVYLHKVNAKSYPSPLCPLSYIHTQNTHNLFNCTHIRTTLSPLDLWTDPTGVTAMLARWTEKLAGGPQAGRSSSPLAKVMGVGRQQYPNWALLVYRATPLSTSLPSSAQMFHGSPLCTNQPSLRPTS